MIFKSKGGKFTCLSFCALQRDREQRRIDVQHISKIITSKTKVMIMFMPIGAPVLASPQGE